jgi:sirohydrochlorin ferrochelatase
LKNSPAYLLVFHGSRDPRPQIAVTRLAELVRERLPSHRAIPVTRSPWFQGTLLEREEILLATAALELSELPLHRRIEEFARQAREKGATTLQIIPLFLLAGVHVVEDIPREVSLARSSLPVEIKPYLGSYRGVRERVAREFDRFADAARILLSHGSRRPGGRATLETLAGSVKATAAYWSVEPSLADTIETLIASGRDSIAILPYFLFPGAITDESERQILFLSQKYKNVKFFLGQPLGATAELARTLIEEAIE